MNPCDDFLAYLSKRAEREPHNAEFIRRLAGSVRKVRDMV